MPFGGEVLVTKGCKAATGMCYVLCSCISGMGMHTRMYVCAHVKSRGALSSGFVHLTC